MSDARKRGEDTKDVILIWVVGNGKPGKVQNNATSIIHIATSFPSVRAFSLLSDLQEPGIDFSQRYSNTLVTQPAR